MRATSGSAASAALRVATSAAPAASASAKIAGAFFGARPDALISTTRATVRGPSSATHAATDFALSIVSARSVA